MGFFASRPSNAPVLWGFVHQGSRMYAYLRMIGDKVTESLILPSSSSSVLLSLPYVLALARWQYDLCRPRCPTVPDSFFMGFFASRPSNAPVLWGSVHQGSRMYAYLRRFGGKIAESLISPSSSFSDLLSFP